MSAPKRRLIVKPEARADINGIRLYTQQRWGTDQRRRYRARLTQALNGLRDYPERGPSRNDLFSGCRNLTMDEHVVFYSITKDEIIVIRVLHVSQDTTGKVRP